MLDQLKGGDLRSVGKVNEIIQLITTRESFDELVAGLFTEDRLVVMRAADAIEKLTVQKSEWLILHKEKLIQLLNQAQHKELKWHLALLVSRIPLNVQELGPVWSTLKNWCLGISESRIVKVNALQGLYMISRRFPPLQTEWLAIVQEVRSQNIPSVNARIKQLTSNNT